VKVTAVVLWYCLGVVAASLAGGLLPLALKVTHTRFQLYLALSGGVMLGASFFHMIPESMELLGPGFGYYTVLGVLGLYFLQRFVAPHSHEMTEQNEAQGTAEGTHGSHTAWAGHHAGHSEGNSVSTPAVIGGLSAHSLIAGLALGSTLGAVEGGKALSLTVFLVIVLHKPADSLTVTAMLLRSQSTRGVILVCQAFFSLLVPLGVICYLLGHGFLPDQTREAVTGAVLAVTAGMFICISLGDLLPEVQFHKHDRLALSAALLAGVGLMGAVAALET
jgi:zinc and cadmium transporter